MHGKPIGPRAHGTIDYGFMTLNTIAPRLFGLKGTAKTLCYAFPGSLWLLYAFTDHPLGM